MNAFAPGMGHNSGLTAYSPFALSDAEQTVWSFFVQQVAYIERQVYEIQYPDIRYPSLVPVDTSANPWTQVVTYFSQDRTGAADWVAGNAQDVPLVETTRNAFSTAVHMAAIGYGYNDEELMQAAQLGMNLSVDKAAIARRASEEFIDRVALFGDTRNNFTGLFNNPNVTIVAAAATGTGGSTHFSDKTPDQILADINGTLVGVYLATQTVEVADTLLLPLSQFTDLNTRRITDLASMTILQWLRENNAYTVETGQALTIRGIRGLDTAGAGATARMVAYRRSPDVVKLHMPMPLEFLPPWRKGPFRYEVPGRFRLGGVDVRRPGAFRYVDGV